MADYFVQTVIEWIQVIPPGAIYLLFFGIAYLENLIPPVPGDVLVAFGGYLAAEGIILIWPVWSLTIVASVMGFMTMYWLGYSWGEGIENNRTTHFILRFIPYRYLSRGKKWMQRWGQGVVMANRFLAGTRSVISLTAGISHLPIPQTMASSLLSSVLWNSLLLVLGWIIQDNWQIIGGYLSSYGQSILVLIFLFVIITIWVKRRKKSKGNG